MTPADSDGDAQRDFLEKALADAGQWVRFADPKALAALAFLGLALSDLLSVGKPLIDAHQTAPLAGWIASGTFWLAIACAGATVLNVVRSMFPRVQRRTPTSTPLYFFADVAAFETPAAYETAVRSRSARELESEIAAQAWEVGRVAAIKHKHAKSALQWVLVFLGCWAISRLALVLST
jgi:Family of unknown function (DUF5706)